MLAQDLDLLGLLGPSVEDDVLLQHIQHQSAAEEAARGAARVLDGLTLADVLALSEAEARQQKAESACEQSQLRAVLRASRTFTFQPPAIAMPTRPAAGAAVEMATAS